MDLKQELEKLADALLREGLPFAICGGIAVAIHGAPRFTKDIDLLVRGEDLDHILEVAASCGFTLPAAAIVFGHGTQQEFRLRRVSKVREGLLLTLDLVLVEPAFGEVWESRLLLEWEGRRIGVVSLEGLARMKRLAGRDQDRLDLANLGFDEDRGPE